MIKTAIGALAAFLALQAEDPNLKYLKERGFSIQKPKKDEWQFKDKGQLARTQLVVANVVTTDATIEMYCEDLEQSKVNYDAKASLELLWKSVSSNGDYKDAKQVGKIQSTTLPNGGLAKQRVWLLDMTLKFPDGTPMEWKSYCFIGHENRSGYLVHVVTKQGMYAKYKADLEWMLSTIKTYRIPKD